MKNITPPIGYLSILLLTSTMAMAAEPPHTHRDHSSVDHSGMDHSSPGQQQEQDAHSQHHATKKPSGALKKLSKLPESGRSRESGFDGSAMMEDTSLAQSVEARCALASRGLVMVDNATWEKCGGKPEGWSKGIDSAAKSVDHSDHSMH